MLNSRCSCPDGVSRWQWDTGQGGLFEQVSSESPGCWVALVFKGRFSLSFTMCSFHACFSFIWPYLCGLLCACSYVMKEIRSCDATMIITIGQICSQLRISCAAFLPEPRK